MYADKMIPKSTRHKALQQFFYDFKLLNEVVWIKLTYFSRRNKAPDLERRQKQIAA